MEIEYIKDKVEKPEKNSYVGLFIAFAEQQENKTVCIKAKNDKEKSSLYYAARSYIKKHNLDWTMFVKGMSIYIVKA